MLATPATADFVGSKGKTLQTNDRYVFSDTGELRAATGGSITPFAVNETTSYTLFFASVYDAQAAVIPNTQFDNFINGHGFTGYGIFDRKFGIDVVNIPRGGYYVGVRNSSSAANRFCMELEKHPSGGASGLQFRQIGVRAAETMSAGGFLTHDFTIQRGYRYWIEGCNTGNVDYFVLRSTEASRFRTGGAFSYLTLKNSAGQVTKEFKSIGDPNEPGLSEIDLPPGSYSLAFRNTGTESAGLVYRMYIYRDPSVALATTSGPTTRPGGSVNRRPVVSVKTRARVFKKRRITLRGQARDDGFVRSVKYRKRKAAPAGSKRKWGRWSRWKRVRLSRGVKRRNWRLRTLLARGTTYQIEVRAFDGRKFGRKRIKVRRR